VPPGDRAATLQPYFHVRWVECVAGTNPACTKWYFGQHSSNFTTRGAQRYLPVRHRERNKPRGRLSSRGRRRTHRFCSAWWLRPPASRQERGPRYRRTPLLPVPSGGRTSPLVAHRTSRRRGHCSRFQQRPTTWKKNSTHAGKKIWDNCVLLAHPRTAPLLCFCYNYPAIAPLLHIPCTNSAAAPRYFGSYQDITMRGSALVLQIFAEIFVFAEILTLGMFLAEISFFCQDFALCRVGKCGSERTKRWQALAVRPRHLPALSSHNWSHLRSIYSL